MHSPASLISGICGWLERQEAILVIYLNIQSAKIDLLLLVASDCDDDDDVGADTLFSGEQDEI